MNSALWYNFRKDVPALFVPAGNTTSNRSADMRILSRKITGIYKIENLTDGKCYIGQSRDIYNRWAQHLHGRKKDHGYYLYNAIKKYGIDNFSFDILEECSINDLNKLERTYIQKYKSLKPKGYNLDGGGNQGKEVTRETRKRMSLAWLFKQPMTKETIEKRRLSLCKPVSRYTKEGKYLDTFQSLKSAGEILNIPVPNIVGCCKKRAKTAGDYQWRYGSSKKDIKPVFYKQRGGVGKTPINQYALNGRKIKTHSSVAEAGKSIDIHPSCISACLTGRQKTAGGFLWRYADGANN